MYGSAGGVWGYLFENAAMRFLANTCNLHITSSIDLEASLWCVITGIVIGIVFATIAENKMDRYRKLMDKQKYVCKILTEILILLAVLIIGILCLKINYAKYGGFLYPKA